MARISFGHKHKPKFIEYYRSISSPTTGTLDYRVALFECALDGCEAKGQQEEWPNEDDKIRWLKKG